MTTTPAPAYTETVVSFMRQFRGCRGYVQLDIRTLGGLGHQGVGLRPDACSSLPNVLLEALEGEYAVRIAPVTSDGGRPADLAFAYALFTPPTMIDVQSRCVVEPEAPARIATALAAFPLRCSFLIDGGSEVVAAWALREPLAVDRDEARATALLARLAEALGADVQPTKDLTLTLPLCGIVRNFGMRLPVPYVEIIDVDPERRYRVEQIEAASRLRTSTDRIETTPRKRGGTRS